MSESRELILQGRCATKYGHWDLLLVKLWGQSAGQCAPFSPLPGPEETVVDLHRQHCTDLLLTTVKSQGHMPW